MATVKSFVNLGELACVRQIRNHDFACPPSHIEQFVSALLYLRDTAALKEALGIRYGQMCLAVEF